MVPFVRREEEARRVEPTGQRVEPAPRNGLRPPLDALTREQLYVVVERIVDPWLASFSPSHPTGPRAQSDGEDPRRNLDSPKPAPPLELS